MALSNAKGRPRETLSSRVKRPVFIGDDELEKIVLAKHTDADLAQLCDVARVPLAQREKFAVHVITLIRFAWGSRFKMPTQREINREVVEAGSDFIRALRKSPDIFASVMAFQVERFITKRRNPRGAPKKATATHFEMFAGIAMFLAKDVGGRLSFDKKKKSGSLIKFLEVLQPVLPDGFISDPPPWSALEEMRTLVNKAHELTKT